MVKRLKKGECPNCKKTLFRRRSIKIKRKKPTKCEYCGFVIEDPYKIFGPVVKT